jgi:hypothetical protein
MVVFTLTTLLTVTESTLVPVSPKLAVSPAAGLPVFGSQFALMFQLLAPGVATFQMNVVAARVSKLKRAAAKMTTADKILLA